MSENLKILMFGWEFPPHISGGLGTACYGLTQGLSALGNVEVTFVAPSAEPAVHPPETRVIGANTVKLTSLKQGEAKALSLLRVPSRLKPYMAAGEYTRILENEPGTTPIPITTEGCVSFESGYGANLQNEVSYFAAVAETLAQQLDFDLIHAHDWPTFLAGKVAKEISGKPLLVHVHATEFDRNPGNINPEIYAWEKMGMEAADEIIAVSDRMRHQLITRFSQDPGKITTLHNAVFHTGRQDMPVAHTAEAAPEIDEIPLLPGDESHISEKRERLPGKKFFPDKLVTFLGRVTGQKGPEFFVEAAAQLIKRMPDVRFAMAGDGDLWPEMVELVARKNLAHRFHFTGFLKGDEVTELLKMSNVYVMPSLREPFGISALEAIQCGAPVIVSRQSGVSEIVQNLLTVNFWDVEELTDAIYAVLRYPALTQHLVRQATHEIESLSWNHVATRLSQLYRHVLAKDTSRLLPNVSPQYPIKL